MQYSVEIWPNNLLGGGFAPIPGVAPSMKTWIRHWYGLGLFYTYRQRHHFLSHLKMESMQFCGDIDRMCKQALVNHVKGHEML